MKVLKFGGTSVGSTERMRTLKSLIVNNEPKIVVLSAMSGTTNSLVEISDKLFSKDVDGAKELIIKLKRKYTEHIEDLYKTQEWKAKGAELIEKIFGLLTEIAESPFDIAESRIVLAQGELLSTNMVHFHLSECGIKNALLPALNFMRIDRYDDPDAFFIKSNIKRELEAYTEVDLFITQGFICLDANGEISNLKRGGSDYSASLIGAAIGASEVEIWTDIDGVHNNDPRYVKKTHPIAELSFDEAAELAYFGAKILHPATVQPCKQANIPVWLKNTMQPEEHGTLITSSTKGSGLKAIAAKDGITAIKIKSTNMLMAYGFLKKVFEIFEFYKTSIDMITTSEVAVAVTIDETSSLNDIVRELGKFATVEVDHKQAIVCVVGDIAQEKAGEVRKIFNAFETIPVHMISYGASDNNLTLLINESDKIETLRILNEKLFDIE